MRHAANVGRMLARLGVHLPIVVTPDGSVINGVGRLEAAARKGPERDLRGHAGHWPGELARAMLNLLSMDFRFSGDSADFLRYGAFRRDWLRRTFLGRAFVLPVYRHKRLSDVRLDEVHGKMEGRLWGHGAGFRIWTGEMRLVCSGTWVSA